MKKLVGLLMIIIISAGVVSGCRGETSFKKGYVYKVDTGDKISIMIDSSDKYNITSKVPFEISKDGKVLTTGAFIEASAYEDYVEVVEKDEKASMIQSGSSKGLEYIMWSYDDKEYNYAIKIEDSKTGIILGNTVSAESAEECFNRMEITVK